jgi:hypothetical protein
LEEGAKAERVALVKRRGVEVAVARRQVLNMRKLGEERRRVGVRMIREEGGERRRRRGIQWRPKFLGGAG